MPEIDYPVLVRSKTKFGKFVRIIKATSADHPYAVERCQLITTAPLVYAIDDTIPTADFETCIGIYVAETAKIHDKNTRAEAFVQTQIIAERIAIARELRWGIKQ